MNKRLSKPILAAAVMAGIFAGNANAASQDECAIWICAPGGFPQGCGAAYSAMIDRIKDKKPPLPAFSSCAVQDENSSQMSYKFGHAAYYPTRRVCTDYYDQGEGGDWCNRWETIPAHWKKDQWCSFGGDVDNDGCAKIGRYIEVFIDGTQAGQTFYW